MKCAEVRKRLELSESVPSHVRKDKHARNMLLINKGICVTGNRMIENILRQAFANKELPIELNVYRKNLRVTC